MATALACSTAARLTAAVPQRSLQPRRLAVVGQRRAMSVQAAAREVVSTDKAPGAVGPYSQAIKANGMVYISGQVGLVPGTKDFAGDTVEAQTEQVMANLGAIVEASGSSWEKVVKTTILLSDMSDFAAVNAIYGRFFPANPPARATFAVKGLPLGALVEIEATALL
ncbi:translational inhibitor [Micractinium conductrix]|uniref:Translational inhibitor n=1 Tax=Micractinium conductrix TaxID=554055 RepID=A0A2P6VPJ2_9CHLO|nr:translational inhibitor [Micractinium conductrix]|eukprot:PSC75989.1 translational inhibitor [Micractinium conductrix]